jgi:putative zinc finger/helix-turn-helix YgiT family protein
MMKKCPQCGDPLETRRENHRYNESGLPNVILENIEIRKCASCGEEMLGIPRIEELHRVLAMAIIHHRERLSPQEVRFLRKWLGWSGRDFASHMGVDPATVSRWERVDAPTPMGPAADRLLRTLVAVGTPVDSYESPQEHTNAMRSLFERLTEIDDAAAQPPMLRFRTDRAGTWTPEQAAA